ncbi:zinc finger protein 271-like [Branchiostoma floridae]|uniref:Zinc finger protein 271-like n=1 Tax=Branchiostoma floridae TaxID=7739 RepID=A0A9J7LC79_BRAFL|nr:zinc finger protein 271-like [Branchiostoma floridae]
MPTYKQEQKVKKSVAGKVKKKRKQTKRERRERYRALAKRSQEVRGLGKGSRSKPFVPPVGYKVIRYEKSLVLMTPEKTRIRGAAAAADLLQERGFKKSLVLESSSSENEETSPSADMEQASGNTTSTTGQPARKKRANKNDADWLEETERLRQLNKRKQNRKKGKKKTSWVCKCKEKFTSKTSYNQHRLEAHPLTCEYCEENFRSRQLLNKHLKTHMPSEDKLDLRGNKLFLCDHCGQFFTEKKLQWHKLKLNEVKMYECIVNNCKSTFRNRAAVQNHIATVHNRNRFPCPHEGCKQTFGEKSRLKSHYKVHTDERSHQCSYCGKMFRRSEHLKVHMRIHTGDNPFNCGLCNYSGRQYNSLRWHMKTHHPEHCENSGNKKDENSKKKVLERDALADKDENLDSVSGSGEKCYSTRSRSHRAK